MHFVCNQIHGARKLLYIYRNSKKIYKIKEHIIEENDSPRGDGVNQIVTSSLKKRWNDHTKCTKWSYTLFYFNENVTIKDYIKQFDILILLISSSIYNHDIDWQWDSLWITISWSGWTKLLGNYLWSIWSWYGRKISCKIAQKYRIQEKQSCKKENTNEIIKIRDKKTNHNWFLDEA